jgi:hypothetical protein
MCLVESFFDPRATDAGEQAIPTEFGVFGISFSAQ